MDLVSYHQYISVSLTGHQGGKISARGKKTKFSTHRFVIKHMSNRWLTLELATNWLWEQWNYQNKYFLWHISHRKEQGTLNTANYKRIVKYLNEKTMKCQLLFILARAKLFTKFTSLFHREDLIHLIHDEIKYLIIKDGGCICKLQTINLFKNDVNMS